MEAMSPRRTQCVMGGGGKEMNTNINTELKQLPREDRNQEPTNFSSGIRWLAFSKYGTIAARIVISIVMARLLAPALFGIIEMAYTFFAFARLMRGFSIGEIIVQRDDLDQGFLSTLYWSNLGICLAATVVLLALSPVAAIIYSNPLVGWVAAALSLCFLLEGMAQISMSLLAKEMNFRAIAIREIAEVAVMGVTCISLAALGFGVWAMVAGTMLSLIVRNIAMYLAKPFRPSLVFDRERFRSCLAFASQMSGNKLLGYVKQNLDKVLIGTGLGASALGIYGLARKLVSLPHEAVTQIVNGAALTRFAKAQNDTTELAELYMRMIGAVSLLSFPLFATVAVLAEYLVPWLGDEWLDVIPLVPMLAAAVAISTLGSTRHRLLIARGMTGTLLKANIVRFVVNAIAIATTVWWGLEPLAWAVLIANFIGWFLENAICFGNWPALSIGQHLKILRPALVGSLACVLAGLLVRMTLVEINAPSIVLIGLIGTAMLCVFSIVIKILDPPSLKDVANVAPTRFRWLIIGNPKGVSAPN